MTFTTAWRIFCYKSTKGTPSTVSPILHHALQLFFILYFILLLLLLIYLFLFLQKISGGSSNTLIKKKKSWSRLHMYSPLQLLLLIERRVCNLLPRDDSATIFYSSSLFLARFFYYYCCFTFPLHLVTCVVFGGKLRFFPFGYEDPSVFSSHLIKTV